MNNKKYKNFLYNFFVFFLLFFFLFKQIKSSNYIPYINYPFALILSNDNIFIIHQNGVSIYDSTFSNLISDEIVFSDTEKITSIQSLSKITISQFENGYIISLINDKIYFFDYKGNFIFNSIDPVINIYTPGYYYTLVPIKFYKDYYFYIIGFVVDGGLYFYYYKFHSINKQNILIKSYIINQEGAYYTYTIKEYGLSCQLMSYNFNDKHLTCFFVTITQPNAISIYYYSVNETDIQLIGQLDQVTNNQNSKIICIKSIVNYAGSKSFICFYDEDKTCYCFKYDINDIEDQSSTIKLHRLFQNQCNIGYYSMKVGYIQGKEEFIISSLSDDGQLFTRIYNESLAQILKINKFINCTNIKGYSILYSYKTDEYYDLSDVECYGKRYPFNILNKEIETTIEEISTNPSTIIETFETTIQTNPTTLIETSTQIETTIPILPIKTSIIENEESTYIETESKDNENEKDECNELEKCLKCNEESVSMNLCIKCNEEKGFYLLNYESFSEEPYIDCVNKDTKPLGFYFNENNKNYELCYYSCATCDYGGNIYKNNCTSCEEEHIMNKKEDNVMNCAIKCTYYYYYNLYRKYKCTSSFQCPANYSLFIKEKKQCTDICSKDDTYKYQYNGECLLKCPENTIENGYLCKDKPSENCILSERDFIDKDDNLTENEIELLSKNYAKEFSYTDTHLSLFKNEIYTIGFYKNSECLSETSFPNIDFGNCYTNIQNSLGINKDLIIGIIEKKINNENRPKVSTYSIIDPDSGVLLNVENLCKDDIITIKEKITSLLLNLDENVDSLLYLIKNNIDIFNLSSPFYTDICYHFDSPFNKDISLRDRILMIFPNITLCEYGCEYKGVNISTMEAICDCKFNKLFNKEFLGGEVLIENKIDEIRNFIGETNLNIIKCYKRFFVKKYITECYGSFIIIGLIIFQIILAFLYFNKSLYSIRRYLFAFGNKYFLYLTNLNHHNLSSSRNVNSNFNSNSNSNSIFLNNFPKRKRNTKIQTTKEIKNKNDRKSIRRRVSKKSIINKNPNSINIKCGKIIKDFKKKHNSMKTFKLFSNRLEQPKQLSLDFSSKNESPQSNVEICDQIKKNNNPLLNNANDDFNIDIQEFLVTEIDEMNYEEIIQKDKRTFKEYLYDKLKSNQIILNTFLENEPLKPKTMKMILLIIDIILYFFINGIFFNEDYISQIFHSQKEETFFSFLTRSFNRLVYTTLINVIINYIINWFFIDEEKNIKKIFKREKNRFFNIQFEMVKIANNIKKKYLIFIIISFIINIFVLYYVGCFNSIYYHSKIEWIKSSIMIFFIMQLLSILVCLLESIIRFIGIKIKSERIFKISLYLS